MQINRFKNEFSATIFRNKYAQGPNDSWDALADRLVEDVCGTRWGTRLALLSREDQRDLAELIKTMRFIPGGRYLYYAGRPYKAYNNCGTYNTTVLTHDGFKPLGPLAGKTIDIYSNKLSSFVPATINAVGEQEVFEYDLCPERKRTTLTVQFTANHRWPTANRGWVDNLQEGDILEYAKVKLAHDSLGYLHGAIFADGNVHLGKKWYGHQLRLCGAKNRYLDFIEGYESITYPSFADGDACLYVRSLYSMKELPDDSKSLEYRASFIKGWLDFDGHRKESYHWIHSVNEEAIDWLSVNAPIAGYGFVSSKHTTYSPSNFGARKPLHDVRLWDAETTRVVVKSKRSLGVQPVFCPFEPLANEFVTDFGLVTGNCYLLRAEEDTREEWSAVTWRAMSCLMTGGGIGIDYSRLRPAGRPLSRTGGVASGPIPLMYAINEIGRNVMQGGSRRSAIYASLNWAHEDIPDFLRAKNWDDGTRERKQLDFNTWAPLDMTNISVNYDDAAMGLEDNPVFLENCLQAMKTGEPGFSFNFRDKQEETLRNACD